MATVFTVYEGTTNTLVLDSTPESTAGMTVFAYLSNKDGDRVLVGSVGGETAGTQIIIPVDWDTTGIGGGGIYKLEVFGGTDSAPTVLVGSGYSVKITNINSITLPTP
jgi:hypothetical protein